MTSRRNQLIDEYLHRFDTASVFLPADRREELKQEIVEHIDAGLEEADARHAEAVRIVLERLGPPADIVAAEVSGPTSTGSTPVVKPIALAADVAHGHKANRQEQPGQEVVAAPSASSPPSRRRTMLLIGAATTALVVGALAFGINTSNDGQGQPPAYEGPAITPTESEGPGSTSPSEWPTDAGYEPTTPPSEVPDDPTASAS
ncbi:HAAS signaling domain-containing protein [Streptomyces sp. NPDC050164]|uniref:HAAS signaling domain-containing protein n=1 Tax=Streptomyces sp. NPDC050164 TaxID=3365605 RepID=UPI0037B4016D